MAAESVSLRVRAMKAVANGSEVRLAPTSERTDEEILAAAIRALEWDAVVPQGEIQVKVANAWVTLNGEVEWCYQKLDAERVVRSLTGVKGVTNLVSVKPLRTRRTSNSEIESALVRSAKTDAEKHHGRLQDSRVVLKGKVKSLAKARARRATRVAWLAPGVTSVDNQLDVSYS